MRLSTAAINSILDQGVYGTFVPTSLRMYMRSGSPPASAEAAETGTLLCTLNAGGGASYGPAANRSIVLAGAWQGTPSATGTIGWFRIRDHLGDNAGAAESDSIRLDGTVSASSGDIILSSVSVTGGSGTVSVDEFVLLADSVIVDVNGSGTFL